MKLTCFAVCALSFKHSSDSMVGLEKRVSFKRDAARTNSLYFDVFHEACLICLNSLIPEVILKNIKYTTTRALVYPTSFFF